jgi:hypothetical protein
MFGTATGRNVNMAIYSEGGNLLPNAKLAQTGSFPTANGTMEAPLSPAVTLSPGNYWIVAIADADVTMMHVNSGGAGYVINNNSMAWPVLPNTFPAGSSNATNETPNFYVVLEDL